MMPSRSLTLLALVAACAFAFSSLWSSADALNLKLSGINYDFRQGPDWDDDRCKPETKVEREMRLLQTITKRVRIYSLSDCNVRGVLRSANELNMTVWLGVWVSNKTSVFKQELTVLKALIAEKLVTDVLIDGINVGSEALYRNDTTPEDLIANFNAVKSLLKEKNLNIPLSITDTLGELYNNPNVVEVQDIVTFNQFPFWNNISIDNAVDDLKASVDAIKNMTKTKPFIISETGWAAGGVAKKASPASTANAARYMKEFVLMAEKQGWKYYYFAGFDTPYRKNLEKAVNSVEAYFGIFNASGKIHPHYEELSIPVTNMTDGAVTPLLAKAPAPATTAPPAKSTALSVLQGSLLSVVAAAAAVFIM